MTPKKQTNCVSGEGCFIEMTRHSLNTLSVLSFTAPVLSSLGLYFKVKHYCAMGTDVTDVGFPLLTVHVYVLYFSAYKICIQTFSHRILIH